MKVIKWLVTIAILAGVIGSLYAYKSHLGNQQAQMAASMPEPAATVDAMSTGAVSYQKTIKVSGEAQAFKHLAFSNELAGKITQLNAESGQIVEKGQVLLVQDHSDEDARLIAARAQLKMNQQTFDRFLKLRKNNEISEDALDQARAAVQVSESDIAVLTTAISKKKLIAPFKGRVGIHNLAVGQYLDNNTFIFDLVGINEFTWVDFHLPQVYRELSLGETVTISPVGQAQGYQAQVIAVNPQLSSQSRNLKYRAQIPAETLALRPHTLVTVSVATDDAKTMISVPDLAVTRDQLGEYLFMLEPEGEGAYRAKQVKVEVGDRVGDQIMIVSGIEQGQLIATKGAFKLFPGMKVYVANQAAPQS